MQLEYIISTLNEVLTRVITLTKKIDELTRKVNELQN